ncbi:hypothetical protein [Planomonospora parontospora]|uniref:hypothetical protein n=1 Tax=Planomonospora parontospora TaxID=58119 RepID=UPI001670BB19|nr:hypothetical protein [Planomonospora parontospora]GGL36537.1 hypothetical protein GCM10014719_42100 [Planomonospora parontospora subsp. antibiotica]GII17354.1 hypothetical protein Ppa05_40800 [Planomonospora parontospora subsp. antibiotica]
MSNAARNARGILAAVLTAACAGWTAAAPAPVSAAPCEERRTAGSQEGACARRDGPARRTWTPADPARPRDAAGRTAQPRGSERPHRPSARASGAPGRTVAPGGAAPPHRPAARVPGPPASLPALELLARNAGLPGLSRASAILSVADAGGVAAGVGFPGLPFGMPGYAGLVWVEFLSPTPDLPGLPSAPSAVAWPPPAVPSVPSFANAAGVLSGGAVLALPAPMPLPRRAGGKIVTGRPPAAAAREAEVVPTGPRTGGAPPRAGDGAGGAGGGAGEARRLPILDGFLSDLPLNRSGRRSEHQGAVPGIR